MSTTDAMPTATESSNGGRFSGHPGIGEGDLAIQCTIKGTRVRRFKDFDPMAHPEPVVRLR